MQDCISCAYKNKDYDLSIHHAVLVYRTYMPICNVLTDNNETGDTCR